MKAKWFAYWWRHRLPFLLGYAGFLLLLLIMSTLFSIHVQLVVYTVGLLALIALATLVWDGFRDWSAYQAYGSQRAVPGRTSLEALLFEEVERLEEAQADLRASYRQERDELEDYYTMWAHQMKIPLAASQLLLGEMPKGSTQQAMERELFKMEHYTGLVLNYLRLQSFHDDLVVEQVDLEELVRQLVKKYSLFFIQESIALELGQLSRLLATDRKWLSLLLEQFLSNAVKYSKGGKVSIYLDSDDLVISDTGIGIAPSDLHRVFERGFSGYNGRRTQQSSGLGLYLAKRIADKLGYGLELTSELGQGTTVRVRLKEEVLALD